MATRTIKFMGSAYSLEGDVSVVVNFNNVEVYSGTVPTAHGEVPEFPLSNELFTFTISTDVTGSIPLTITSSGGVLVFNSLHGNYVGYTISTDDNGKRIVVDGAYVLEVAPVDTYDELNYNTVESDGKNNVVITPDQGDGQLRDPNDSQWTQEMLAGDWFYKIWDGSTLTCDFIIEFGEVTVPTPS